MQHQERVRTPVESLGLGTESLNKSRSDSNIERLKITVNGEEFKNMHSIDTTRSRSTVKS